LRIGDVTRLLGLQIPPPAPTNKPLNLEQYLLSTTTLEKRTIDRRAKALKRLVEALTFLTRTELSRS
jgi:hypothetical protein